MKKSIVSTAIAACAVLCSALVWAVEDKPRPETPLLPAAAYRVPLDQIIVEGRLPYWEHKPKPRFDKPKVAVPKLDQPEGEGRLQWFPRYTREDRDNYNGTHDQLSNPQPLLKIFEIRF